MYRVFSCIAYQHDWRLTVIAALVCLVGAVTTLRLFQRARDTAGSTRATWLGLAAFAGGASVWATHFVAILAYQAGVPVGYEIAPTLISLVLAVVVGGAGFWIALLPGAASMVVGGAIAGIGYTLMHYIGMTALELPGTLHWDLVPLTASVMAPLLLMMVALLGAGFARNDRSAGMAVGTGAFFLGIVALHFVAMSGLTVTPDPSLGVEPGAVDSAVLAVAIAVVTFTLLTIALVCIYVDRKLQQEQVEEETRLHAFADASVEGIVLCNGDTIVDANVSFEKLIGAPVAALVGRGFASFLVDDKIDLNDLERFPMEAEICSELDVLIPVELVARDVPFRGGTRRVYAVRDLSERRAAQRRIHHMAYHDALTGLPNRAFFSEALRDGLLRAEREGEEVAILCLDLDRFKEVNDIFGHQAGDQFLQTVARDMQAVLKPGEILVRIGGDEFVVMQHGMAQPSGASELAERLERAVTKDIEVGGVMLRAGVSIGIAIYPQDGTEAEVLHGNADAALYRAKQEERGSYRFFKPEMDLALRDRRTLQSEMRQALARGEFCVHYQPQARTASDEISGFEALLRWEHPTRGLIGPTTFIAAAEETGFIIELGEFVLRTACAEAASWDKPLTIAVNLSPVQVQHGNLVDTVRGILEETGLDPARLELEITESVLIHDFDRALTVLNGLKVLGASVAMDDFGTGYSSLAYLQAFPFDRIKIDRSFIARLESHPQSEAIIRAIVGLGRGLNVPVTAEGVETPEQRLFLSALQCHEIQGFLIGEPNPIQAFHTVVRSAKAGEGADKNTAAA